VIYRTVSISDMQRNLLVSISASVRGGRKQPASVMKRAAPGTRTSSSIECAVELMRGEGAVR
jgi:hypothetical protein